jgi:predicted acylesterase/phospholipase RssA
LKTAKAKAGEMSSKGNHIIPKGRQLCLLSLDGGGVRGVSILHILKRIMQGIEPDAGKPVPKPIDYFDMICGTSTGGIIAIMLGRLGMSIDECIEAYEKLCPTVFARRRSLKSMGRLLGQVNGRFDHRELEQRVKDMIREKGFEESDLLKTVSDKCRVFVCAGDTSNANGDTVIFASYNSERQDPELHDTVRIWEAVRATSAAPSFFDPIQINGATFNDGATRANNPVNEIWREAYGLWGPGRTGRFEDQLQCLVSVGTGVPDARAFGANIIDIGKTLVKLATDSEQTARVFRVHHQDLFDEGRCFRFSVLSGLGAIGLEESDKLSEIKVATRNYCMSDQVQNDIKKCSSNLRQRDSCRFQAHRYCTQKNASNLNLRTQGSKRLLIESEKKQKQYRECFQTMCNSGDR